MRHFEVVRTHGAISVLQVELKFPAPGKPGNYQYTVYLRSDSYMGLDQIKPLKVMFNCIFCWLFKKKKQTNEQKAPLSLRIQYVLILIRLI